MSPFPLNIGISILCRQADGICSVFMMLLKNLHRIFIPKLPIHFDASAGMCKHFPRYKESLFSFQSATGSEIQSNVTHMAAILKSNMAAPWRKFWHCQNVPRHRKHRYRHLNFGPRFNRTGDMGKTMVILAPYWKSIWRPPEVANLLGLFF